MTLLPFSGLQSAVKRRNSKTLDFRRRDSISVYATYSLPNSKSSMRRFSSYEELAPIFQEFITEGGSAPKSPESSMTDTTTVSGSSKPKGLSKRRGSISFGKKPRSSPSPAKSNGSCADLDAQLAMIKGQLVRTMLLLRVQKRS